MNSLFGQRNVDQFRQTLAKNVDYLDLRYSGPVGNGNITIHKGDPILNKYKIWLQSGKNSYTRHPEKGGFFANNLNNYPFDPSSEKVIEKDLIALSQEKFPEIAILQCTVVCMVKSREWKVDLIVADKATGLVALDQGQSLTFKKHVDN